MSRLFRAGWPYFPFAAVSLTAKTTFARCSYAITSSITSSPLYLDLPNLRVPTVYCNPTSRRK